MRQQILDSARVLSIPMRIKFRGITTREVLLFEGPKGWAEWSPFTEYEDEEASIWLRAAIEFAFGIRKATAFFNQVLCQGSALA